MPKLQANSGPTTEIIRVDIKAETINEKDENGNFKFSEDQLRSWLHELRGDREAMIAKKMTRAASTTSSSKAAADDAEDDLDDDDLSDS